jgi:hypothetical protein
MYQPSNREKKMLQTSLYLYIYINPKYYKKGKKLLKIRGRKIQNTKWRIIIIFS